jgi:putative membrane protein
MTRFESSTRSGEVPTTPQATADGDAAASDDRPAPSGNGRDGAQPAPGVVPRLAGRGGAAAVVRHGIFGFLMGSADVVPGVSGGTVALVCGIYARLIDAVRDGARALASLVQGRFRQAVAQLRGIDWALLVPLLAGIGVAVLSLASLLDHLLEDEPVRLAGLFLGLVLGSIVMATRLFQRRIDGSAVAIAVVVAVAAFVLLGLREETTAEAADAATAPVWAYPVAAMVAICAMILPGVSGAFILVTVGMYQHVLAAVNDRDIGLLVLFLAGAVVGLALFSRVLSWLIHRHHDRVLAAMVGLMLGSLRVLWPWPGGALTTELSAPSSDVAVPILLAVVGFVAVTVISRWALRSERPSVPPSEPASTGS